MKISNKIYQLAKELGAENVALPEIEVAKRALDSVFPYLLKNNYQTPILVVDDNTYRAAGKELEERLVQGGMQVKVVCLQGNRHHQVIADEATLVQLLVETTPNIDVFIAVGSGTIHDITRFCAGKMNLPFISVPTAASVDGFTSKGAPLILRSVKQTIQTVSPVSVFADIDILKEAPREMTAAGFGDILAKYTSLFDWKVSELIGEEPYHQLAADMMRKSLDVCVENVEKIMAGDDEGIAILIHSLIESGLVMLLLDFSRPASGGEHHLSHYWEMDLLKKDAKQLLHGAKVGVATAIIANLYKQKLTDLSVDDRELENHSRENWNQLSDMLASVPSEADIKSLLEKVGGPTTTEELGVDDELVQASLNEAHYLRDRCTGLFLLNHFKKENLTYPLKK